MSTMTTQVFADESEIGRALATELADRWANAAGHFVLGCPAGRSPTSTFRALSSAVVEQVDLSGLIVVMMDEYLSADENHPRRISAYLAHSCRGYAEREIIGPLNAGRPMSLQIPPENLWVPDPADPLQYDRAIESVGGVDLFIVASGASDGHVGFHGPGASLSSRTEIVTLAESTRRDNLGTFPGLRCIDDVPRQGVSIGLGTIRAQSAEVIMLMHGPDKARSAQAVLDADTFDPAWPATFIHECARPRIWLDRAAAVTRQQEGH